MTKPQPYEPTTLDADYYPRIKIRRRWYLIVPEVYDPGSGGHEGCAFYRPERFNTDLDDFSHCKLMCKDVDRVPTFTRHDCGDTSTVFVAPAKFQEYMALVVANKLEGKT